MKTLELAWNGAKRYGTSNQWRSSTFADQMSVATH